jgi:hypothetical protein
MPRRNEEGGFAPGSGGMDRQTTTGWEPLGYR